MKILTDRQRVQSLLEKHPHLRDSDYKLIANLFHQDIKKKFNKEPEDVPSSEFFKLYSEKEATNAQSVIRLRCKLQEEFPHLRGKVWEERHKEEPRVVKDINSIKKPKNGRRN